jgi:hypothetical protein
MNESKKYIIESYSITKDNFEDRTLQVLDEPTIEVVNIASTTSEMKEDHTFLTRQKLKRLLKTHFALEELNSFDFVYSIDRTKKYYYPPHRWLHSIETAMSHLQMMDMYYFPENIHFCIVGCDTRKGPFYIASLLKFTWIESYRSGKLELSQDVIDEELSSRYLYGENYESNPFEIEEHKEEEEEDDSNS